MIPEMRITEVARQTGASTDEIRYFEAKGYVQCRWITLKNRRVRDYSDAEIHKMRLIIKYRRQGFEHGMAYERAMKELLKPRLI